MTTLPLAERIARARRLGVCADCSLDRDATLSATYAVDERGLWRGAMYLNLLLSCARNCDDFPAWARGA